MEFAGRSSAREAEMADSVNNRPRGRKIDLLRGGERKLVGAGVGVQLLGETQRLEQHVARQRLQGQRSGTSWWRCWPSGASEESSSNSVDEAASLASQERTERRHGQVEMQLASLLVEKTARFVDSAGWIEDAWSWLVADG